MKKLGALLLGVVFALPAFAQGSGGEDLVGTWKRDDGKLFRLDWDSQAGEITGTMIDPPENSVTHLQYAVELHLHREGDRVRGKAVWIDQNPKKGQAGQPDFWSADSLWEFDVTGPGKLAGRSEYLSFGRGKVFEKDWDKHTLERLPVVTLGAHGKAPDKVEAGQPIDEAALAGTWKTSTGAFVAFKAEGAGFVAQSITTSAPITLKLTNEANVLKGVAALGGVEDAKTELHLSAPGRLEGRTETVEGEKGAERRGWAPLALERLPRIDAGPVADATAALAPGAGGELASLDYKREDGLYLRLTKLAGAAGFQGELVTKTKELRARVKLEPGPDNKLVGRAVFELDGAPVEAHWELSPQADGSIDARCEWLDWDAASKTAVSRGATAHKFKPLRRVG